jgi:predicted KAP-like P-loop ATPase
MSEIPPLRLWDDNPSLVDLLGFDVVVEPIVAAIGTPNVDPLAIGVHSPWGGGKSTVLNLLEAELGKGPEYLLVRTDPWQYDNHDDVRGDLIVEILDQVAARFDNESTTSGMVTDLVKRLSWARIGLTLGKGALTMQWKVDELIEAFTPRGRNDDRSMAGFKEQFATFVKGLPQIDRLADTESEPDCAVSCCGSSSSSLCPIPISSHRRINGET